MCIVGKGRTSRKNGHEELVGCCLKNLILQLQLVAVACSKALVGTKWTVSHLFYTNEHESLLSPRGLISLGRLNLELRFDFFR